jgi:hypothetical protein
LANFQPVETQAMPMDTLPRSKKLPKPPARTTPGFAFSMLDRAIKECLATRQFDADAMAQVVSFFGNTPPECVYCGSPNVQRWDHLVPITKGGDTVLGNMVLACASCDDSKRDLSFDEWILCESKLSPKSRGVVNLDQRIEQIRAYVQHFGYVPMRLEDKLDQNELNKLNSLRAEIQVVRGKFEQLIASHRAKTGKT